MALEARAERLEGTDIKKSAWIFVGSSLLLTSCALPPTPWLPATVHPRLDAGNRDRVPLTAPVALSFDFPVDPALVHVSVTPALAMHASWLKNRLIIAPAVRWQPQTAYVVSIAAFRDSHHGVELKGWHAEFRTQPPLLAEFDLDGKAVRDTATAAPQPTVSVVFPLAMQPATVRLTAGDQPIAPALLRWAPDHRSLTVSSASFSPGQSVDLAIVEATSARGDILSQPARLRLSIEVLEPSNTSSGVTPDFVPRPPLEIVIENSGPARPQLGLQGADIVVEYISEYSISRMTAIYFNALPPLIGPVRSCRMINIPLNFAFRGVTMCSGASDGTLGQLWRQGVPVVINDYDHGGHFFRSASRAAPHNLYTSADRADRLRHEIVPAPAPFTVDPPHDDIDAGNPAAPPDVGLHAVSYRFDPGRRVYLRFDHGAPFVDAATRVQVAVKTVAIVHAPFGDAGWTEDVNGGAHSIIYDLAGQGPAELYSDGNLVAATWHISTGIPLYFTDAGGNVIRLNTGLTWVHVLGNGQLR
ncbi:MAG TPA: DUF3048 domain-containing protein [Candidatus Dormibacteraeota bacterium]|nr:DUF3048 domain-containing protein [Candidatus Dormibacteraeota bacterium]